MKVHHIGLVCSSQENADRFYEGILGLKKIKTSVLTEELTEQIFHTSQQCLMIYYANENLEVEVFVPGSPPMKTAPFVHICLEVKDREGFLRRCKEMGIGVSRIPKGDSLLTFVEDYDRNLFEIKEVPSWS